MSVKKHTIASPLDLQATMDYGFCSAFHVFRHGLGKATQLFERSGLRWGDLVGTALADQILKQTKVPQRG
jgi:hypothetical protein